jgi:diguanylate cyclase (GGDEF)-like protein
MNRYGPEFEGASRLLINYSLVGSIVVVIATPAFVINNIASGRNALGVVAFLVVLVSAVNAWSCVKGRYCLYLVLLGLVPAIMIFLVFTFRNLGVIGALWSYPVVLIFYMMLPGRYAWFANIVLFGLVNYEAWSLFESDIAIRFTLTLLMISLFAAVFIRQMTRQQIKLERQAITDSLTGLFNRSHLDSAIEKAIQQARRTGLPMSLLMVDIDHFKKINDVYGHQVGDQVLRVISDYLQSRLRVTDMAFRIGGEEFLVLAFNIGEAAATRLGQELCRDIASLNALADHPVTVSIGIAPLGLDDDMDQWMKHADRNLYSAKANGRNRVVASA